MVIECESCSTRFHLADGRIPAKGARVRCSNCHHRFHVKPPKTSNTESDAAKNSLSTPSESAPSAAPSRPSPSKSKPAPAESATQPTSESRASSTKGKDEHDLDNPEFLFDTPGPATETGISSAGPESDRSTPSAPSSPSAPSAPSGDPQSFGTAPEFEKDAPALLNEEDAEADRKAQQAAQSGPLTAPSFELERPIPGAGFEPSIPGVDVEASTGPDQPESLLAAESDDDMPVLEVERNEVGSVSAAPPKAGAESDAPDFDDVLSKDLDDDDDDTMSAWDSLGAPTTPSPVTSAPIEPPKTTGSDNVITAAHNAASNAAAAHPETYVEADYDPAPRRKANGIVQGISIALVLVLAAGAVRGVASRAGGGLPGPELVNGAGWRAANIEAFHAHDLGRRRILVVRGTLAASAAVPAPKISAALFDRSGRALDSASTSVLRRLGDEELTPEALKERFDPRPTEPIAESLPAAPVADEPAAKDEAEAPVAEPNAERIPERGSIDGFTLLIPEPPADARRFEIGLASR